mmetsp:Transcript_41676/g.42289  ORF Transcript_41676/g.42289 Transcript_41676/m.42289 type:complete len:97 (-) Transcript_41676:294-584(-)
MGTLPFNRIAFHNELIIHLFLILCVRVFVIFSKLLMVYHHYCYLFILPPSFPLKEIIEELLGGDGDQERANLVRRSNGLKVEQLKGEIELTLKGGH